MRRCTLVLLCAIVWLGCGKSKNQTQAIEGLSWSDVVESSKGATVRFAMWDGDPMVNAYIRDFVVPKMASEYGIQVKPISGQGNGIVSRLLVDIEANRASGDIDLMWINGETFYQLRQLKALYGPFTERLPNAELIDWSNSFISLDFQQPVQGYECPWGNVQFAIIYHPGRVSEPPRNHLELAEWVRAHPGRFSFDTSFTGLTFLKSLMIGIANEPKLFDGPFDEVRYKNASQNLWKYLNEIRPFLWRKGETYPESVSQLHRLFMNNEIDFSMSNNDGEVDNKAVQGIIPFESRAYVFESGTIRNSHYVGIPFNSSAKGAALVLANFLISAEAQFEKSMPSVWGDGTVLDVNRLPAEWKAKFAQIPGRERVESRESLEQKALAEPAPEIMVRLHEDFRKHILIHAK